MRSLEAAGLAVACAAWAQAGRRQRNFICTLDLPQVEREIPWDADAHEELQPEVASTELEGLGWMQRRYQQTVPRLC